MKRETWLALAVGLVVFVVLMPVLCMGSSDDPTLGCDTWFGWRLPWSDGPEGLAYVAPLLAAIGALFLTKAVLRRRRAG